MSSFSTIVVHDESSSYILTTDGRTIDKKDWKEELHPRDPDGKFAKKGEGAPSLVKMLKEAGFAKHPENINETELYHHPSGHSVGFKGLVHLDPGFVHYLNKKFQKHGFGKKDLFPILEAVQAWKEKQGASSEAPLNQEMGAPSPLAPPVKNIQPEQPPSMSQNTGPISAPVNMNAMTKVGGQLGSNPGGKFMDKDGKEYYVKFLDKAHSSNELVAAALYSLIGMTKHMLLKYHPVEGGEGIATDWMQLSAKNVSGLNPYQKKYLQMTFPIHAWLANWDVVGLDGDNIGVQQGKHIKLLDLGGSLLFRAQGGPKGAAFDDTCSDWETMRNPKYNPQAAKIFAGVPPDDFMTAISLLKEIDENAVAKVVDSFGQGFSFQERTALIKKLMNRKEAIIEKWGKEYEAQSGLENFKPNPENSTQPKSVESENTTNHPSLAEYIKNYQNSSPGEQMNQHEGNLLSKLQGKDFDAFSAKLAEKCQSPLKRSPNKEEVKAIWTYVGGDYKKINKELRASYGLEAGGHMSAVKRIKQFLKDNPLEKEMIVHRKVGDNFAEFLAYEHGYRGEEFQDYGIISSSYDPKVWSGSVHLNIKLPKGSLAADISPYSHLPEKEVLISPGSRFRVTKVHDTKPGDVKVFDIELIRSSYGENEIWHSKPRHMMDAKLKKNIFLQFHDDFGNSDQEDKFTWHLTDVVWSVSGEKDLSPEQAAKQHRELQTFANRAIKRGA